MVGMTLKSEIAQAQKVDALEGKMMRRVQSMVLWYERKAKRFKDLPLWDRDAKQLTSDRAGSHKPHVRRKAKPLWDDPPDIELALKHRDCVDRIEGDLVKCREIIDSGTIEGKDLGRILENYTRLERAALDHMREIRGCLEAFGKEQVAREALMTRLITETTRLKVVDRHHRENMEFEAGANDLDRKNNAELEEMIREAEAVTPTFPDVETPQDSEPMRIEANDDAAPPSQATSG